MSDNKHKHLDFIQGVVNRMAANSFMIKGWTVTLVSALFAFAASKDNDYRTPFIIISFLPVIAFWILDGYFLWQERLFRSVYNEVIKKKEADIDFEMNPSNYQGGRNTWTSSTFSPTLIVFYGLLVGMMGIIVWVMNGVV